MKKIINGKRYDTNTAEELLLHEWMSQHPNWTGPADMPQARGLYRTKNGVLFAFTRVTRGWGRDKQTGATGCYSKTTETIEPCFDTKDALRWCEEQDCFSAKSLERVFSETIEDA